MRSRRSRRARGADGEQRERAEQRAGGGAEDGDAGDPGEDESGAIHSAEFAIGDEPETDQQRGDDRDIDDADIATPRVESAQA
jgi:hypothetical protein